MTLLHRPSPRPELRHALKSDCAQCVALCCTALCFSWSDGFPADKAAGTPCVNLLPDYRCAVHNGLSGLGLRGCISFDCLGAGQRAAAEWDGRDREALFQRFHYLRRLHQILLYLWEAETLLPAESLWPELGALLAEGETVTAQSLDTFQDRTNAALKRAMGLCCAAGQPRSLDLTSKCLRAGEPEGRNLSMALLIAADLRGCSLRGTSLLGADLRDADLSGADLSDALFLDQMQVNGARGDENTKLPPSLARPRHWR